MKKKQPTPAAEFALVPSRQCLEKKKDWRQCGAAREAMDKCVEEGEQQRFFIDSQCSRWKRQYQSCLLESKTMPAPEDFCSPHLDKLSECIRLTQSSKAK